MEIKISRDRLKQLVSVRVDEFLPSGSSVIGGTAVENPLETIDKELNYAAKYVLRNAREDLAHWAIDTNGKHFDGDDVIDQSIRMDINSTTLIATVVCPENFLRVVAAKTSAMIREVRQFFAPNDPEYKRQAADRFTGGNYAKPYGGLKSFDEYETNLTVADSSQFSVGDDVVGAGSPGSANVDIPTGVVKAIDSDNDIVTLKNVVGSFFTSGNGYSSLDLASGGTPTAISAITTEHSKYLVLCKANDNVDASLIANAVTLPCENGSVTLATGDIIVLPKQITPDENGTYKIGATAAATIKLSNQIGTENSKYAVELFRARATSDTLDVFHYIPDILPEYFPEELQDALIDVTAARVLKYMGNFNAYSVAMNSANQLLGVQKVGVEIVPPTQ